MKRNNLIFAVFAAIVVAASSCAKEQVETSGIAGGIPAGTPMTITAGVDTKIYYQNGRSVRWTKGDDLRVFNDEGAGSTFTTQNGGDLEAEFTCDSWIGSTPVFAVHSYPSSLFEKYVYDGTKLTAYLRPSQEIVHKQSFSKYSILSVGTISESEEGSYSISEMKNVFGSIGFKLSSSGVKSVTLTGNNDEGLAGWVDVDYNNGEPTWTVCGTEDKKASTSIVATVSGGGAVSKDDLSFVQGTSYYINVLPQTFEKGLTLTIEKQNGAKAVRKIESEIVLERNEARSFTKALDNELPFDPLTIHFTASDGWPFVESIVAKANQSKTGESGEIYHYKYGGGDDEICEFEIANPKSDAAGNNYTRTDSYIIRFNDPGTGSWIRLPAIEDRKLCSVKVANHNSGGKTFHISTNPGTEGSLFSKTIKSASATYFSSDLEYNTSYYIYLSGGFNFQLTELELIYSK